MEIEQRWKSELQTEFEQPYFRQLIEFVRSEYDVKNGKICYPPSPKIFAAFDHSPFDKVKVVIIGQDPYHGPNQANGLCFSVAENVPVPPSLVNIFKEIRDDVGKPIPSDGNLERWADQGVLLLNATLTVRKGEPGSHQKKGWETFTDAVIKRISDEKSNVVFLLWGNYAQQKGKNIDMAKHLVLKSGHPSPMSANQGKWFGNRHFSQANAYLKSNGLPEIDW
ncbi:uracil-DNA glycosylase [Flavobacterium selenitireducens]|uniref:uracil-DNA glycosylase n=1 Tax=Flavobacterium selenitireducens TaxID=2722704 RepID=UPI00168BE3D4|nr:uracil-DNA glycosylase [Flavobacterium selenitireducens]MBD3580975.1 uracil-DNA glycosylase [Flavobacterium selenitireducens]